MTRRQKVGVFAIVLLGAVLLLWLWFGRKTLTVGNASLERKTSPSPSAEQNPATSAGASLMSPAANPRPVSLETQQRKFIEAFNTPITFFGQVVDQNATPVVGADVQIAANDSAFGGKPSHYTIKSDTAGRFSISGIKGITLAVEVSKPGYRVIPPADNRVTSSGVFNYALSSIHGKHEPNPENPVRFVLYKIGPKESLYRVPSKDYPIKQDGSPLVISLDPTSTHQVVLRCWSNKPKSQGQYDWHAEIAPINGGLLAKEGLSFEAPIDGYISKDSIEMPASLPREHWDSSAERSYFIRFDDGLFASAKVQIHSSGDHFVTWESLLNATAGSRNLEPGQ